MTAEEERHDPDGALLLLQAALANALDRLLGRFAGGSLSPQELTAEARRLLRQAHARAAYLGRLKAGDFRPFGPWDEAVGLRAQFAEAEFLAGLLLDMRAGRYGRKTQGGEGARVRRGRATLYALKLVATATAAWLGTLVFRRTGQELPHRLLPPAGTAPRSPDGSEPVPTGESEDLEVRWVLGIAEHCEVCPQEAAQGWRPAGELLRFPGDGSTPCITRCKCHLRTRHGEKSFANDQVGLPRTTPERDDQTLLDKQLNG